MTEQQQNLTKPILETIVDDEIRSFADVLLNDLPEYIWHAPASSSGRFHPQYSLGEGGLMRHQISVVRFANFFFELEQFQNEFTSKEMDLMRVACLVHDGQKSGSQADYEKSNITKFTHPIQMADIIRSYDGKFLDHDSIEFVADCIASHMGQWNTTKKSSMVLPKPLNKYQQVVHMCDYLASRKCLTMEFEGYELPKIKIPPLDEYRLEFGKHKGRTIPEISQIDMGWIFWAKENLGKEPIKSLINQFFKKQEEEDLDI